MGDHQFTAIAPTPPNERRTSPAVGRRLFVEEDEDEEMAMVINTVRQGSRPRSRGREGDRPPSVAHETIDRATLVSPYGNRQLRRNRSEASLSMGSAGAAARGAGGAGSQLIRSPSVGEQLDDPRAPGGGVMFSPRRGYRSLSRASNREPGLPPLDVMYSHPSPPVSPISAELQGDRTAEPQTPTLPFNKLSLSSPHVGSVAVMPFPPAVADFTLGMNLPDVSPAVSPRPEDSAFPSASSLRPVPFNCMSPPYSQQATPKPRLFSPPWDEIETPVHRPAPNPSWSQPVLPTSVSNPDLAGMAGPRGIGLLGMHGVVGAYSPVRQLNTSGSTASLSDCSMDTVDTSTQDATATPGAGTTLPVLRDAYKGCALVSAETVAGVVAGRFNDRFDEIVIVDCRFPYEYAGVHIQGAINLWTRRAIFDKFFRSPITDRRVAIIMHCEFSQSRGPDLYAYLRGTDRSIHFDDYGTLYYPHLYLLNKGFNDFFATQKASCTAQVANYTSMFDEDCAEARKHFVRQLKDSRKIDAKNTGNLSHMRQSQPPALFAVKEDLGDRGDDDEFDEGGVTHTTAPLSARAYKPEPMETVPDLRMPAMAPPPHLERAATMSFTSWRNNNA